jgi:hypothetical protein
MELTRLVDEFSDRLASGTGSLFVGSGVSVPSKLPDWTGLLKAPAKDLGLDVGPNDNLPQIAQFIVNHFGGNRGMLIQKLRDTFSKPLTPNEYHRKIAQMNVSSIWTTNYDTLLEQALPDFFVRTNDAHISHPGSGSGTEIIKMHGCIRQSPPNEIVITSEDYEDYFSNRPATARRLEVDLVRNSFLFIGYGYGDPNMANIMIEARRLAHKALGHHYMIQKKASVPDAIRRQELHVADLARIGINCALIDDYDDLGAALAQISLKSRGQTVFITGGHGNKSSLPTELGKALAGVSGKDLILLDGQSTGVSRSAISSFSLECLNRRIDIRDRVRIFSNPYAIEPKFENDLSLLPQLKQWRTPLLKAAQIMVVFDGGKGTEAELEVAREHSCKIIPVPEAPGDLPSRLLGEASIANPLLAIDSDYLDAAKTGVVSVAQICRCVERFLTR